MWSFIHNNLSALISIFLSLIVFFRKIIYQYFIVDDLNYIERKFLSENEKFESNLFTFIISALALFSILITSIFEQTMFFKISLMLLAVLFAVEGFCIYLTSRKYNKSHKIVFVFNGVKYMYLHKIDSSNITALPIELDPKKDDDIIHIFNLSKLNGCKFYIANVSTSHSVRKH